VLKFQIVGAGKKVYSAKVVIKRNRSIEVWSDEVKEPVLIPLELLQHSYKTDN